MSFKVQRRSQRWRRVSRGLGGDVAGAGVSALIGVVAAEVVMIDGSLLTRYCVVGGPRGRNVGPIALVDNRLALFVRCLSMPRKCKERGTSTGIRDQTRGNSKTDQG